MMWNSQRNNNKKDNRGVGVQLEENHIVDFYCVLFFLKVNI